MIKFFQKTMPRLGIQVKLTLMFILLSTIPLLLMGLYVVQKQINFMQEEGSRDVKSDVREFKVRTSLFLTRIQSEMLLFSNISEVKRLMQNLHRTNKIDQPILQAAQNEFLSLLKNNSLYFKIDFLDKKGNEVFAVLFDKGKPYTVSQHHLLKRPLYYYVYAVTEMNPGEIQLTPSEIRHPYTRKVIPTIDCILPLYNQHYELTAILVASVRAAKFFEILDPPYGINRRKVLIVNREGFYLYHSQRKNDWNTLLANRQEENIFHDYPPKIVTRILTENGGTITEDAKRIVEFASIFSSGNSKASRYIVFEDVPTAVVFSSIRPLQTRLIILLIIVVSLSLLFGYWMARRFLLPIKQLIRGTNIIREGNLNYQLDIQCRDERQDLVESFNQMVAYWQEKQVLEDEIRESEERLRTLTQTATDAIISIDSGGNVNFWNHGAETIFGYLADEIVGKPVTLIMPARFHNAHQNGLKRMVSTEKSNIVGKTVMLAGLRKDGSEFPFELSLATWKAKEQVFFTAIIRDITERKRIEKEINMLAHAIKSISECVSVTDMEDNVIFVNDAFLKTYGYERHELIGKSIKIIRSPNNTAQVTKEILPATLRGGWQGEILNKRKDGSEFPIFLSTSIISDDKGQPIALIGVARDIFEQKQMEEEKAGLETQLRQSQKMETIGTLAGGIAHDFNNILAPILGYADMALEDIPSGNQARVDLEQVVKAANRAKDLVQQILIFSRQAEGERKPVQIHLIVKEALKLLRASLPTTIEMRQNIDTKFDTVLADPTQIHQVLINLCTNASHAMRKSGGLLEVTLDMAEVDKKHARQQPNLHEGKYVRLTVRDTGHGMDRATVERIFEPFFTTKGKGEGTGLGLSVVHGIVKNHGGEITVHSRLGKGTTFQVYLPPSNTEIEQEISKDEPIPRGKERVLLVDDEKEIAIMMKEMLGRLGYDVTVRTSSLEALKAFRAQPDGFDIVFTDQTMPNKTGVELAKEIMRIRTNVPIILMTGFSETITPKKAKKMGIREYIMKPVLAHDLGKIIRQVLDRKVR